MSTQRVSIYERETAPLPPDPEGYRLWSSDGFETIGYFKEGQSEGIVVITSDPDRVIGETLYRPGTKEFYGTILINNTRSKHGQV